MSLARWLRRLRPGLILTLAICASLHAAAADVLVLLSASNPAYRDAGNALAAQLAAVRPDARIRLVLLDESPDPSAYSAVAAIGSAASRFILSAPDSPPAVHALVPASSFPELSDASRAGHTAVYIDQPARRQVALIRGALPAWNRLALLHGEASATAATEIAAEARRQGMQVTTARVGDRTELYRAIQRVLGEPAVLLALPDAAVFNSYTVQNILLSAYRENSPVVGFSPAYVRAGALLALYTAPASIGRQAAQILASSLSGAPLPAPQYPATFRVAVNDRVARSLNIGLPSAPALTEMLRNQESAR